MPICPLPISWDGVTVKSGIPPPTGRHHKFIMKANPHNDPAFEARKQAFAQALMDAIKAIRRAHGLPEDLKDWTPAQLAEREVSRQILMKYVFGEVCNAPPLDQQPSPLPTPFAPTVHT